MLPEGPSALPFDIKEEIDGAGFSAWIKCLPSKNPHVARYGEVQTIGFASSRYALLIGIVIGGLPNFLRACLRPFRQEGSSEYWPVSMSEFSVVKWGQFDNWNLDKNVAAKHTEMMEEVMFDAAPTGQ